MGVKTKPLVSVIILNWNQKGYTLRCLDSLLKTKYKPLEIILVDNGSTDGTVEEVRKKFPKVKILANKRNLGYAKGNNQGFKQSRGEYILLLNNDTEITPNLVERLVEAMELDKQIGVAQAKIYWMSDRSKNDLVGTFLTPTGFVYYFGYGKPDEPKYMRKRTIFFAKGAAMMIRREVIHKIGLFDEDYITYFEEYDFCWRVWLAGWTVFYIPEAVVYHRLNVTGAMLKRPYTVYLTFRNRIATLIKNLSLPYLAWLLPLHLSLCLMVAISYTFRKREWSKAVLSAIVWNLRVLQKTLKKRSYIQNKLRRISDREILKGNLVSPPLSYYLYLTKDMRFFKDIEI